ncbi:AAA family ATPase [Cytobacillus sp. S13-E01]|uniref:ATP-binding protein n=1 Tax=Cytobacillus sp. S13-E01 TaxID=3031326 RepID=UPI0023D81778|nr:AAA family ATPase [Cytobacillus sp. S13-E01]MDF0726899.1 AAA family ATPase [Cytobacillus sp. S13-E01]
MRITDLQIYGYGKLENKLIENLSPSVQVFYGLNEAGKSTLMSFIHSILFGFPTRQQQEIRYEPKNGTKYGGRITIESTLFGTIVVERIPGKASGDVTVYLPDGSRGGEEILNRLFQGMDKSFYQGIYSFGLHGLQGVQQMNAEELGSYLFSSGVVGTDGLVKVNERISKELDALFKPTGRKPTLNIQMQELKEVQQRLGKSQEKNNTYKSLIQEKENLQQELDTIELEKLTISNETTKVEQLLSLEPIIKEQTSYLEELNNVPPCEPFPVDGIKRLEHIRSQLLPYNAQLSSLSQKEEEWKIRAENINLNVEILKRKSEIRDVISNLHTYDKQKYEKSEFSKEINQKNEDILHKQELIGFSKTDEDILQLDTSISKKEKVKSAVNEYERLMQQKQFLDEQFTRSKATLEESEEKIKDLQVQLLPEVSRKNYENMKNSFTDIKSLENEKRRLVESINGIERNISMFRSQDQAKHKSTRVMFGFVYFLLLIALSWSLVSNQWLLLGIIIVVGVVLSLIKRFFRNQELNGFIKELESEKAQLEQQLALINGKILYRYEGKEDLEEIQEKLIKDKEIRRLLDIENVTLFQKERANEKIVSQYEKWENQLFAIEDRIERFRNEYTIPEKTSADRLVDIVLMIEELKSDIRQKQRLVKQLTSMESKINTYEEEVERIRLGCNIAETNIEKVIRALDKTLETENEKEAKWKDYNRKIEDVNEQNSKLQLEIEHLNKESLSLFEMANADNEDEFRLKGKHYEEKANLSHKLRLLNAQLRRYKDLIKETHEHEDYKIRLQILDEKSGVLKKTEKDLQQQLSEINLRIKELEEGGTFTELLHTFEQQRSLFQEDARKWAVHSVAKDILNKTIEKYRTVRLPQLLSLAAEHFRMLTDGVYVHIYSPNDQSSFIVERVDGVRFTPNELSQATAEQLYVALRIALGKTMHPSTAYPFIIDDSFVNFDSRRLEKIVTLLKTLSLNHQILVFTCHKHVAGHFKSEEIVNL